MIRFYHGHVDSAPHLSKSLGFDPTVTSLMAYSFPTNYLPRVDAKREHSLRVMRKRARSVMYRFKIDESRLDVVLWRASFIPTRHGAKRLLLSVNGQISSPSRRLSPGDFITVAHNPLSSPIPHKSSKHPLVGCSFDSVTLSTRSRSTSVVPFHRLVDVAGRSITYLYEPEIIPVRPEIQ